MEKIIGIQKSAGKVRKSIFDGKGEDDYLKKNLNIYLVSSCQQEIMQKCNIYEAFERIYEGI